MTVNRLWAAIAIAAAVVATICVLITVRAASTRPPGYGSAESMFPLPNRFDPRWARSQSGSTGQPAVRPGNMAPSR